VGIEDAVFFTSGCAAGFELTTVILLSSTGREPVWVETFSGCGSVAEGGRLVGLLEVVLTTLSRSCDIAELLPKNAAKTTHNERQTNFFVNFKP